MSELNGRLVYNRAEQQHRSGRSLSNLEKLYRNRQDNGHPEPVGTLQRAKVWDAEEWDTWHQQWTDTTGLATLEELAQHVGRSRATARNAWSHRDTNHHPAARKRLDGIDYWHIEEYITWFTHTYRSTRTRPPITDEPSPEQPYTGDIRLTIARTMLTITPPTQHPDLPELLAHQHPPTSAATWSHILTAARNHPTDSPGPESTPEVKAPRP